MTRLTLGTRFIGALAASDPTLSLANMTLEQIEVKQSATPAVSPLESRIQRLLLGSLVRSVAFTDESIPGPGGKLLLRIYKPTRKTRMPRPLVLHFHGGGWMVGSVSEGDWLCSTVARGLDAVVVSVDYRLAPQNKFPAALEDCYAALVWCSENAAALGADANRIGLMGDSAGGNLAAAVCLFARERGGPAIRHQALLYPPLDGSLSGESYRVNETAIILSTADIRAAYGYYLNPTDDPLDWRVSPLHAPSLAGLPPAIVIVAGHDPLHDDGVAFAHKLEQAGVSVTLKDYPAMPHGFISFPHFSRDAKPAVKELIQSQRAAL